MSQPVIPTIPTTKYQRAAGDESSACKACGQEADGYAFCANVGCLAAGNAGNGAASRSTVVTVAGNTYVR